MQGLNYVAALLLLVMKTEEDAFWMLAVLLENVLVRDCYTTNLSGCHVEQRVFKDLLSQKCPRLVIFLVLGPKLSLLFDRSLTERKCYIFFCRIATHLDNMGFDVSLVATEWFLCLFSKSFPSEVSITKTIPLFKIISVF